MNPYAKKVLLILLGGWFCFGTAFAQTLKIATLAPEGSDWMTALKAAGSEIEARSQGRIELKFYGGGVQGTDQNVIRKIRVGQLHGFTTTGGGLAALQPDAGLYSLPLVFNDVAEVTHVRDQLDDRLRHRLEEAGWVNFGFTFSGFAHLMSNTPIDSLAALERRRIWVPDNDRIGFDAIRTLGGAPVQMPITDVLTGLETDLLDTVVTSAMGAVVFQWHGQVRYVTELPLVYLYGALVIHEKPFSKLTPPDQTMFREVMERTHGRLDRQGEADDARFMKALIDGGVEPLSVDHAQVESWRGRVLESNRQLGMQGEFDIALLDEMETMLDEYRGLRAAADSAGGSKP